VVTEFLFLQKFLQSFMPSQLPIFPDQSSNGTSFTNTSSISDEETCSSSSWKMMKMPLPYKNVNLDENEMHVHTKLHEKGDDQQ
jgi:hypothetical protein